MKKRLETKDITRLAILIAMSVILKSFLSIETPYFRATFYDIPLMIAGIMFGPILGAVAGFTGDWIHVLLPNFATGFSLMTVSAMMWGIIPGLLLFYKKEIKILDIAIAVVIVSTIAFSINTVQLYLWFGPGVIGDLPARLAVFFVKLPLQIYVVDILYNRVIVHYLKLIPQK